VNATREVTIRADGAELDGTLVVPDRATAVVAFAHGSGSSRHSPRNQLVAATLRGAGLGTLLFDLLDRDEEALDSRTGRLRFDIPLLSGRLVSAIDWLAADPTTAEQTVGCFGASTGAAAALVAAAQRPDRIGAVVSRGGRPDLAGEALASVTAPTLLIVGGDDPTVVELNERARAELRAPSELDVIPGATHLFEEPGALERVAALARDWLLRYLVRR
jgi:putative phosphoribosyl transferase